MPRLDEATREKIGKAYGKYQADHPEAGAWAIARALGNTMKLGAQTILRWGDPQEGEKIRARHREYQRAQRALEKPPVVRKRRRVTAAQKTPEGLGPYIPFPVAPKMRLAVRNALKNARKNARETVEAFVADNGQAVKVVVQNQDRTTEFSILGANYSDVVDGLRQWASSTYRKV